MKLAEKSNVERYLVEMLDQLVSVKDITYGELNHIIPFGNDKESLRKVEEEYPDLGIAKYGKPEEGISTISLLASVTSVLIDKRLAVILQDTEEDDEDKLILGFTLLECDTNDRNYAEKYDISKKKGDPMENYSNEKVKKGEGMVEFEVKCAECKRVFEGDTEDEAQKKFKSYHESIKKTGIPLWVIKNGQKVMHGTKTAAEVENYQKKYSENNLNENETWDTGQEDDGYAD